ncbi:ankyrin repeat domain-containing protein [Lewinella sp. 4G2]|uniref:ankyrin repeat domain-containing protein n=1 Tax=Lewinella sp. 4G2 TaxID=1803372 RepID=UPI0007B4DD9C|nr:ankyrin repeat domain-containing protein [Lewinella sp. 4G2]OAV45151.1 hypothetical protein A3850_011905 [Lewinella sp. 4G2]
MTLQLTYEAHLLPQDLKKFGAELAALSQHQFSDQDLHKYLDDNLPAVEITGSRVQFSFDPKQQRVLTLVELDIPGQILDETVKAVIEETNAQLSDGCYEEPERVALPSGSLEIFLADPGRPVHPIKVSKLAGAPLPRLKKEKSNAKYGKKIETYLTAGDLMGIRQYYQDGGNLNASNKWNTPLLLASILGPNEEIALFLMRQGADVHLVGDDGESALFKTGFTGYVEVARQLLQMGLDVNQKSPQSGMTPLMVAANRNHLDLVKLLVENGATINVSCDNDHTPLTYTSSPAVVEYLLKQGRTTFSAKDISTALEKAKWELEDVKDYQTEEVIKEHEEIVDLLAGFTS